MPTDVVWVIEPAAFPERYQAFGDAIRAAGHRCIIWDDAWWSDGSMPALTANTVVFHGSLGNADRIARELDWRPGAFCSTAEFYSSAWYPRAARWLLHDSWVQSTVADLVADPIEVAGHLASDGKVFVRPDSPLKPFSGRVVQLEGLTREALDYGFYYDDDSIPVIVAPVRDIRREWRFVVAQGKVLASSGYLADGRIATSADADTPIKLANEIAAELAAPDDVYVVDLCEVDGEIRLIELNPFSGADIYACDAKQLVSGIYAAVATAN